MRDLGVCEPALPAKAKDLPPSLRHAVHRITQRAREVVGDQVVFRGRPYPVARCLNRAGRLMGLHDPLVPQHCHRMIARRRVQVRSRYGSRGVVADDVPNLEEHLLDDLLRRVHGMDVVPHAAAEPAVVLAEELLDLGARAFFIAGGGVEGQVSRIRHEQIVVKVGRMRKVKV